MRDILKKIGYYALALIFGLYGIILMVFLSNPSPTNYNFFLRFFALSGFYFLLITILLTPFIEKVYQVFGKPFLKIHHLFGAFGLASATLHPITYFLDLGDLTIFIPNTSSWYSFWLFAGKPALYVMYIAVLGAFLRKKIPEYWRIFHSLMYLVVTFVFVHALLIGTDFGNIGITIIYTALFLASILGLIYKRIKRRKL